MAEYLDAVCREIDLYRAKNITIDTVFFGGGTPSLLTPAQFKRITDKIRESFILVNNPEFTIEANPKTLNEEKLRAFMSCGVNRLSIGLQSIHENEQKILGRIHNFEDFLEIYNMARAIGIRNINVDLMYGIPEQTEESFSRTLQAVTELAPEHISLYGLILEEGTPLHTHRATLNLPTEDAECDMYYLAADFLRNNGYSHYEISNYCKDGYACKHNLKYWHNEEYIGVGLAAYSYYYESRFGNTTDIKEYLGGKFAQYSVEDKLDRESRAYEHVMLALRLSEGFSFSEYERQFGVDFRIGRESKLKELLAHGLISMTDERLSLTESGFYVSNNILTELI